MNGCMELLEKEEINMKQEILTIGKGILVIQINHWALFSVAVAVSALMQERPQVILWIFSSVLPVLLFLIRRYMQGFGTIIGCHLFCLVGIFLIPIPSVTWTVIFRIYEILWIICSFVMRIKENQEEEQEIPPVVAIGIIGISLFGLHTQGYKDFDKYYVAVVVVYFFCYYIKYYFQKYLHFLTVNKNNTGFLPREEIFAFGIKSVGMFTLLGVPFLLLISDLEWFSIVSIWLKKAGTWLGRIFYIVFSWIGEILFKNVNYPKKKFEYELLEQIEQKEAGWYWEVLQNIIMVIVPIVLFCFLCVGIVKGIQLIKERLNKKLVLKLDKEKIKEGSIDIREKCERKKKEKKEKPSFLFAFLQPNERIRYLFKQKVLKNRIKLVQEGEKKSLLYYTARECGSLLLEEQLVQVYEKARYSGEKCTKEDVKKAVQRKKASF